MRFGPGWKPQAGTAELGPQRCVMRWQKQGLSTKVASGGRGRTHSIKTHNDFDEIEAGLFAPRVGARPSAVYQFKREVLGVSASVVVFHNPLGSPQISLVGAFF